MNQKQRDALVASIIHWEDNLRKVKDNQEPAIFEDDCECCAQFPDCKECPVANYTGREGCLGTPWVRVQEQYYAVKDRGPESDWTLLVPAIQEELDFLKVVLDYG